MHLTAIWVPVCSRTKATIGSQRREAVHLLPLRSHPSSQDLCGYLEALIAADSHMQEPNSSQHHAARAQGGNGTQTTCQPEDDRHVT